MANHAGFGAVAYLTEDAINEAIASYVRGKLGPFWFPLPQTLTVGSTTVAFAGIVEVLTPTVEAHPNPTNLIRTHFTLRSTLRAQLPPRPIRWTVEWGATIDVALISSVQDGRIVLGIDTSKVVFQPLAVNVLAGPAMPQLVRNALQSQQFAAAVTAFIQTLPPITASPPLLKSEWSFSQDGPNQSANQAPWFTVWISVTRIVIRPLERGVAIGVDLAGTTPPHWPAFSDEPVPGNIIWSTAGNAAALSNLGEQKPTIYLQTISKYTDPAAPPLVRKAKSPYGNVRVSLNMDVVKNIVWKQITPQVSGTRLTPPGQFEKVILKRLTAAFEQFTQPYSPWPQQDGLAIKFKVAYDTGQPWVPAIETTGRLIVQSYLREPDGTTEFVVANPDTWRIYVAKLEVDLPWWVDVALLALGFALSVALPAISPLVVVALIGVKEGIIPSLIHDAETKAKQGLHSAALSFESYSREPLPGLNYPYWERMVFNLTFGPATIDLGMMWIIDRGDKTMLEPPATITPLSWPASNPNPIPVSVKLRDDLERLAGPKTQVRWEVYTPEGTLVTSGTRPYWTVDSSFTSEGALETAVAQPYWTSNTQPGWVVVTPGNTTKSDYGNGIGIPHLTEAFYYVDTFIVRCVVTTTLGSQVGEIWSGEQKVQITGMVNRYYKYAQWGPHRVFFRNSGTDWEWWTEVRTSKIHRTGTTSCKMVRYPGNIDSLPFPWKDLSLHRDQLCDYCFFGGPDKSEPYPEHDWHL